MFFGPLSRFAANNANNDALWGSPQDSHTGPGFPLPGPASLFIQPGLCQQASNNVCLYQCNSFATLEPFLHFLGRGNLLESTSVAPQRDWSHSPWHHLRDPLNRLKQGKGHQAETGVRVLVLGGVHERQISENQSTGHETSSLVFLFCRGLPSRRSLRERRVLMKRTPSQMLRRLSRAFLPMLRQGSLRKTCSRTLYSGGIRAVS